MPETPRAQATTSEQFRGRITVRTELWPKSIDVLRENEQDLLFLTLRIRQSDLAEGTDRRAAGTINGFKSEVAILVRNGDTQLRLGNDSLAIWFYSRAGSNAFGMAAYSKGIEDAVIDRFCALGRRMCERAVAIANQLIEKESEYGGGRGVAMMEKGSALFTFYLSLETAQKRGARVETDEMRSALESSRVAYLDAAVAFEMAQKEAFDRAEERGRQKADLATKST